MAGSYIINVESARRLPQFMSIFASAFVPKLESLSAADAYAAAMRETLEAFADADTPTAMALSNEEWEEVNWLAMNGGAI